LNDTCSSIYQPHIHVRGDKKIEVKIKKDSSSIQEIGAIYSKNLRLQLLTYHTMQLLSCQKVFLSVLLAAAAAARCFALAWQQCSKLGNFSVSSRKNHHPDKNYGVLP